MKIRFKNWYWNEVRKNLKNIVCLGISSVENLSGIINLSMNLGWCCYGDISSGIKYKALVVYHPSYLLRIGKRKEIVVQWKKGLNDALRRLERRKSEA